MKVFISWSGTTSHLVAKVLRDWLPSVIQVVKPYVSSEDIDKGSRWSSDIATELDASSYGIICLTKENISAPWINFEAGALGKSVDKSNVSPFLFRINPSDITGPLVQYQSTKYDRADIYKLTQSINACCGDSALESERLIQVFEVWWPKLEEKLDAIPEETVVETPKKSRADAKSIELDKFSTILEELLELTRGNFKLMRDPESFLPKDYLQYAIGTARKDDELSDVIADAYRRYRNLESVLTDKDSAPSIDTIIELVQYCGEPLQYLREKYTSRRRRVVSR